MTEGAEMEIQIGERLIQMNLVGKDGNRMSVEVDGKIYNVDVCMLGDGQYSILNEGVSYSPFIVHEKGSRHYSVSLNYSVYEMDMLDSQARYMRMRKNARRDRQSDRIKAPMPAKIVKVYVEAGQKVRAGEPMITFEAMKMQSTVQAVEDCVIRSVACRDGESVMAEQVLLTLMKEVGKDYDGK